MLDGHEWTITSSAKNLPPYDWCPRVFININPLIGFVGAGAREGRDENCSKSNPLAIRENAANAELIASAPAMHIALELLRLGLAQIRITDNGQYFQLNDNRYSIPLEHGWNDIIEYIGWDKCRKAIEKAKNP